MTAKKKFRLKQTARELYRQFQEGRWLHQAEDYLSDKNKMHHLLGLLPHLFRHKALAPVLKDLILLYYYIKDIVTGHYHGYSYRQMLLIVALLIYVVSPIDIVPDWIPGAGFLDDAALIGYVVKLTERELDRYYRWAREGGRRQEEPAGETA